MNLNDVRKLAIRKRLRIRFPLSNGLECVVQEDGLGKVPRLQSAPVCSIEEEFANASEFILEPVEAEGSRSRERAASRILTRNQLAEMAAVGVSTMAQSQDHEE